MLNMVLLDTDKIPSKSCYEMQERLKKFGELTSYVNTNPNEVIARCENAQIILVNKDLLTIEHFKKLPNLKYVIVVATGYNNVDVNAARQYGIIVSNLPTYSVPIVAQHTWALLLELTNQVGKVSNMVKNEGKWGGTGHKHLELAGLTLGVVGFGNIAQAVIKIALAFGMQIIVNGNKSSYTTSLPVQFVTREELFKNSDVITLHCPLTDNTAKLINATSLSLMKTNCILVNTARGGLVNETDLYNALYNKQIKGAGLDVFSQEPIVVDNPLLLLDNCIMSPHNAWVSNASMQRWQDSIIECVENFLKNKPINLV